MPKFMVEDEDHEWKCEVEATFADLAAYKAAELAHAKWAWEATWPIVFRVTDEKGEAIDFTIERESEPVFYIAQRREVKSGASSNVS